MKAIQLAKARNWDTEMHCKKLEILQPVVIGICWWTPDITAPDPVYNKLREFKVQDLFTVFVSDFIDLLTNCSVYSCIVCDSWWIFGTIKLVYPLT